MSATTVVAVELQRIYEERGELTPTLVELEARSPENPLHGYFEWDDKKAAEQHRINQAARLIRSVKVTYKESEDGPKNLRAWVNVRDDDNRGGVYRPVMEVVMDDFTRTLVLRNMTREWQAMRRRYEKFEEFADMVLTDIRGDAG